MPTKRGSKARKQTAIGFYPTLNKPATAVGKYISAPGKFWNGCPAADKEKRFKCAVVEFSALHDYGDGVKGAGFSCKEMGEDGRGKATADKLHEHDLGLLDPVHEDGEGYVVQAGSN